MLNTEIAEVMEKDGKVYEIAEKVQYKQALTSDEKEISSVIDAWAKEIGEKGKDADCEIAAFVRKTINEEVYNTPDELLDSIFTRGNVGEFDDYEVTKMGANKLVAYDSAKGGNVDKSYIDLSVLNPTWKHKQVETDISYTDLRRNGFKSIATLTTYAVESLKNAMFADIFTIVDAAITDSAQVTAITGGTLTQTAMDALTLYVNDRDPNGTIVTLTKYAQAIRNMSGYTAFMSEAMKDNFNRYGLAKTIDGLGVAAISSAKKTGAGSLLIPDKRIFGLAGSIGNLDMKGEVRVYETMDNNNEKVDLKITGFEYGYCITDTTKIYKVTFSA